MSVLGWLPGSTRYPKVLERVLHIYRERHAVPTTRGLEYRVLGKPAAPPHLEQSCTPHIAAAKDPSQSCVKSYRKVRVDWFLALVECLGFLASRKADRCCITKGQVYIKRKSNVG